MAADTILILGGAGMVGEQVAREAARELQPARIVICALTQREVDDAVALLKPEMPGIELVPAAADIFLPQSLQGRDRGELVADRATFDVLFDEIFSSDPEAYAGSALYRMIE